MKKYARPPACDLNDKISSIKVSPVLAALIYEEPLFQGNAQYFEIGKYLESEITQPHKIGSLKIQSGLKATFFTQDIFLGSAVVFESSAVNVTSLLTSTKSLIIEAVCKPPCLNGQCVKPNQCQCASGWSGSVCNQPVCENECVNGICQVTNLGPTCVCYQGWEGSSCQKAVCQPPCKQGECKKPYVCECNRGWIGKACDHLESICGDSICDEGVETCKSCPADCGSCPPEHVLVIKNPKSEQIQPVHVQTLYLANLKIPSFFRKHQTISLITLLGFCFLFLMLIVAAVLRAIYSNLTRKRTLPKKKGKTE